MIWRTQFEEVSVDLGQGRSVGGNIPYLVNQDGVELRVTGQLGDDIDMTYKDQKFGNGITINIPAVRLLSPEGQLVEVLLYQAINQESPLNEVSVEIVADFINIVTENLVNAVTQFPKFFGINIEKHGTISKIKFVLSSSKRWPELKHLIAFKDVV